MKYDYKHIEKMRNISFLTALSVTNSYEDSEDIAQEVILSSLNYNNIQCLESWIRRVSKNKAISFLRTKKTSEQKIVHFKKKTKRQAKKDIFAGLTKKQVCKLLSKEDYEVYKSLKKANNRINKYAEQSGLLYNSARKKAEVMKKNLQSRYLYQLGYKTELILSYNEWQMIYSFLKKYVTCSKKGDFTPIKRQFKYAANEVYVQFDTYECFTMLRSDEDRYFHLIFAGFQQDKPIFLVFTIVFLKKTFRILDCYLPPIILELEGVNWQLFEESAVKEKDFYIDDRSVEEVADYITTKRDELGLEKDDKFIMKQ